MIFPAKCFVVLGENIIHVTPKQNPSRTDLFAFRTIVKDDAILMQNYDEARFMVWQGHEKIRKPDDRAHWFLAEEIKFEKLSFNSLGWDVNSGVLGAAFCYYDFERFDRNFAPEGEIQLLPVGKTRVELVEDDIKRFLTEGSYSYY